MAVLESGLGTDLANVGAVAASGLHVTVKPHGYGAFGHYQLAVTTGAVGAGASADSEVFQFRWNTTTRYALIQRVWLTGFRATTAFAAGAIDFKLTRATAWTASGTGGTSLTLSSPAFMVRAGEMGVTGADDIRIATTAALGAGTKTLDTYDMGLITTHSSGGVGSATPIIGSLYLPTVELYRTDPSEHPLVLAVEQGFVVRATVPATGVWNLGIGVRWCEAEDF